MEHTKIEMMLEEEMRPLKEMCEKVTKHLEAHLAKGLDSADTMEVGAVVDMIKDLCEAKAKVAEACYYKSIAVAMEEEDEERRYYRGRSHTTGRYVHRGYEDNFMPEYMRDMDRSGYGRMYYSGNAGGSGSGSGNSGNSGSTGSAGGNSANGSMGYSEGYSDGQTRGYSRGYEDGRRYHSDSDHKQSMEIEESISELSDNIMAVKSNEDKEMIKQKLQRLMAQIQ